MKHNAILVFLILAIVSALSALPTHAAEVEGIYYDEIYMADNVRLNLIGVGLLRYWGFKAYTGAFYLEEGATVNDALSDTAKRIELEYFRSIKGKDFGPATNKSIAKNVDSQTFERLRSRIDYHNSLYIDVQPGDRYSLTYVPGKGTELSLNGESRGIIDGSDFAAAIFSIWLGPKPISKSFKKQILGR
ncbi:MAG: chalcone isomerase family protein [Desulfobacterales bacterium]|jgi:hypothetical protein